MRIKSRTTLSLDELRERISDSQLVGYYLGINTKDPSANGDLTKPILTISAYNEENEEAEKAHRYVYLISADNTASIDLATGE